MTAEEIIATEAEFCKKINDIKTSTEPVVYSEAVARIEELCEERHAFGLASCIEMDKRVGTYFAKIGLVENTISCSYDGGKWTTFGGCYSTIERGYMVGRISLRRTDIKDYFDAEIADFGFRYKTEAEFIEQAQRCADLFKKTMEDYAAKKKIEADILEEEE